MDRAVLLALTLLGLAGCVGDKPWQSLGFEDKFGGDGKGYLLSVSSQPPAPKAGMPFTLGVELMDAQTGEAVRHITYSVQILDSGGNTVFVDSIHAMAGAPYRRGVTLQEPGAYTLFLGIEHGMDASVKSLYRGSVKFRVSG